MHSESYDLELNVHTINLKRLDLLQACHKLGKAAAPYEINADGGDEVIIKVVVGKPQEKTGLTHTRVANKQNFEQVVAVGR
jgi:hypothetical protein